MFKFFTIFMTISVIPWIVNSCKEFPDKYSSYIFYIYYIHITNDTDKKATVNPKEKEEVEH